MIGARRLFEDLSLICATCPCSYGCKKHATPNLDAFTTSNSSQASCLPAAKGRVSKSSCTPLRVELLELDCLCELLTGQLVSMRRWEAQAIII